VLCDDLCVRPAQPADDDHTAAHPGPVERVGLLHGTVAADSPGVHGIGNLTSRTEAFGTTDARTTSYQYDALGRQILMTAAGVVQPRDCRGPQWPNGPARALRPDAVNDLRRLGNAISTTLARAQHVPDRVQDLRQLGRIAFDVEALTHVTGSRTTSSAIRSRSAAMGRAWGCRRRTPITSGRPSCWWMRWERCHGAHVGMATTPGAADRCVQPRCPILREPRLLRRRPVECGAVRGTATTHYDYDVFSGSGPRRRADR